MEKQFLKECLRVEVIGGKSKQFSWCRAIRHAIRQPKRRFLFWWRIASYLFETKGKRGKEFAKFLNRRLIHKYNTEIALGAKIKPGLSIAHYNGVVISSVCEIGYHFLIRQNTTIGLKTPELHDENYKIIIGDHVTIGANSCIIGNNIKIGNNVVIGAMTYLDKDIPDNCIYYTQKIGAAVMKET